MWMPVAAQKLRESYQDVSLAAIINAQVLAGSVSIMIPRMLLVLYQLTLWVAPSLARCPRL